MIAPDLDVRGRCGGAGSAENDVFSGRLEEVVIDLESSHRAVAEAAAQGGRVRASAHRDAGESADIRTDDRDEPGSLGHGDGMGNLLAFGRMNVITIENYVVGMRSIDDPADVALRNPFDADEAHMVSDRHAPWVFGDDGSQQFGRASQWLREHGPPRKSREAGPRRRNARAFRG